MSLPPVDQQYYAPEIETMPRADLEALQLERLQAIIPHAYEHSALVRETWDEAGVKPADIRSLDDFQERVPFIDKDTVRRFRDERGDPFGGHVVRRSRAADGRELDVGHDRRSDARARVVGRRSEHAVDHHARHVGLGRAARRLHLARAVHLPRAHVRLVPRLARHDADALRLRAGGDGAVLRAVARVPSDRGLQLRFDAHQHRQARCVIGAVSTRTTCSRRTRA